MTKCRIANMQVTTFHGTRCDPRIALCSFPPIGRLTVTTALTRVFTLVQGGRYSQMTQRYLNGEFHRSFGSDYLSSPSGFVQWGEILVAVELFERLAALDGNDNLIGYIGDNASAQARPGWPNTLAEDGRAEALSLDPPNRMVESASS